MKHTTRVLSPRRNRIIKMVVCLVLLGIWLHWDLSQAFSDANFVYTSFFPASESKSASTKAATVAIVRSDDPHIANPVPHNDPAVSYSTIEQMVRHAVELSGGLRTIIKSGDTVLIKPNIVQQDSSGSGGVTDVRVVKAVVKLVDEIDHGKIRIVVGDGSPRPFTTFEKATGTLNTLWTKLFDVPGYQELKTEMQAAGIDFRISNLNGNHDTDPWSELEYVDVPGGGSAQPQGGKYYIHKDVLHASVFITVPVMKIHEPGITVALKNQMGIAPSTKYGFSKTSGVVQDNRLHKLSHLGGAPYAWTDKEIVDLCAIANIRYVVVDAIACLETEKTPQYPVPGVGGSNSSVTNQVRMNMVIAGYDPVAVDHVCARLMGVNPDDVEHITLAERIGLGTNNPDSIAVVGLTIEQARIRFKKNQSESSIFGQGNRTWLLYGTCNADGASDPMNTEYLPNESSVAPSAGANGWSQSVYFINDRINLKDYYVLGTQKAVSYAFTYFSAPADQDAELWIGSDEALKVYLNGSIVYNYSGIRTFKSTAYLSEIAPVRIKKGLNRLLVKSLQTAGMYDFSMNICEVEPNILYRGNRVWGLRFTTEATIASPTLLFPVHNATDISTSMILSWGAVPGASQYRLQVGTDTLFGFADLILNDTTKQLVGLKNYTSYFWRVTGQNANGDGPPSPTWKFSTIFGAPALVSPGNTSILQPVTPVLRWRRVVGATSYRIQVATDSTFSSGITVDVSGIVDTSRSVGALSSDVLYYWRVQGNREMIAGAFSLVWSFRTSPQTPSQVQLLFPPGHTIIRANVSGLSWRKSTPQVAKYSLQLARDSLFSSVSIDTTIADTSFLAEGLKDATYWWRVRAYNASGWGPLSDVWMFTIVLTDVTIQAEVPIRFELKQNYPNPFNPSTRIVYGLAASVRVNLTVLNALGQMVATLINEHQEAGYHEVKFDGSGLSSGVYLYRIQAGDFVETRKLLLVR